MIEIAIRIHDSAWSTALPDAGAVVRRAASAALGAAPDQGLPDRVELGVVLADDAFVRRLNRSYRGQDRPTDVLAFPMHERPADAPPPAGKMPLPLGDVVLARETVERDSGSDGVAVSERVSHLVVHGVLHLLGYDHDRPDAERTMRALESRTLLGLGIGDPYATLCATDVPRGPRPRKRKHERQRQTSI